MQGQNFVHYIQSLTHENGSDLRVFCFRNQFVSTLEHKSEFWNKDEEKRITLGFGSSFENRVAYKYLFD